jgi:hypothetical protein
MEEYLRGIRGVVAAVIVTLTEPDMLKSSDGMGRNPYLGRVRKRSTLHCSLGSSYAAAVNEQRQAEGQAADFVADRRKWGTRVPSTPLIEHKGELYLEYLVKEVLDVEYLVDGRVVPWEFAEEFILPWLRPRRSTSRQGVEDEVIIRCVKLTNLEAVQMPPPATSVESLEDTAV